MIGLLVLILVVVFFTVIFLRALRFTPKPQPELSQAEMNFDRDAAVDALARLVRCKTISYNDHSREDEGELKSSSACCPSCTRALCQPVNFSSCRIGLCFCAGPAKPPAARR